MKGEVVTGNQTPAEKVPTTERRWLLLPIVLALAGCEPTPDMSMKTSSPPPLARQEQEYQPTYPVTANGARFSITRVGVFRDTIAYGDTRGIYVIEDRDTGREYVGISGIGISETGRHSVGKSSTEDER